MKINNKEVLLKTVEIVKESGKIALNYFKLAEKGELDGVVDKSPDNPVSDADLAVDRYLKEKLTNLIPYSGWLSEETVDSEERLEKEYVWIVDPIDGTKEFIFGIPEFAISVALTKNKETVLGVIYNPVTREIAYAGKNTGVTHENIENKVSRETSFIVDASRSEVKRGEFEPFLNNSIKGKKVNIKIVGSIAYKLFRTSIELNDATWSRGPKNEWDIAAGVHLINESGGKITNLDEKSFVFNNKITLVNGLIAVNKDSYYLDVSNILRPYRDSARKQ